MNRLTSFGLLSALSLIAAPAFAATDASDTTAAQHHVRHAVHHAHRQPVGAAAATAAGAATGASAVANGPRTAAGGKQCWVSTVDHNGFGYATDCSTKGAVPTSPYYQGAGQ